MLKVCLVFWKSEPLYAYKRYAYKKKQVAEALTKVSELSYCTMLVQITL